MTTPTATAPEIDYLARDYDSLRGSMLDVLTAQVPSWTDDTPIDQGVAIVEALAYAADYLSYYQDAVATEAYLETARRRISLRRHARLLGYRIFEGANAQVQVTFDVSEPLILPRGTQLLTRIGDLPAVLMPGSPDLERALVAGAAVFETLEAVRLSPRHSGRDNRVWADHGRTVTQDLGVVPSRGHYRPVLEEAGLTWRRPRRPDAADRASVVGGGKPSTVPAIHLVETLPAHLWAAVGGRDPLWWPRYDLLASGGSARHFVVEIENDGHGRLRFGDDTFGRQPFPGSRFRAVYRVGLGPPGNVGPSTIGHVVTDRKGIVGVRNPEQATGGWEPESNDEIRARAPFAFHQQLRCVADQDYIDRALRYPGVQAASVEISSDNSLARLFVQRSQGQPLDAELRSRLERTFRPFLLIGTRLEIVGPAWVDLEIELVITPKATGKAIGEELPEARAQALEQRVLEALRDLLQPGALTFGQDVQLAGILQRVRHIPGVERVRATTFRRSGESNPGGLLSGCIKIASQEIARVKESQTSQESSLRCICEGGEDEG